MPKLVDLTGQKYAMLFVESRAPSHKKPSGQTVTMWNCVCDCGNRTIVSTSELRSGGTKSCGCLRSNPFHPKHPQIKPGDKFGYLTAKEKIIAEKRDIWIFSCICGKEIQRRTDGLWKNPDNCSCGCMRGEIAKQQYANGRKTSVKDLTGQIKGKLYVIERVYPEGKDLSHTWWKCICSCGKEVVVESGKLISGSTRSCGCYAREKSSQIRLIDLAGKRFGKWTVICRGDDYICEKNGVHCPRWICKCDCGTVRLVFGSVLRNGTSNSCGCSRESKGEALIRNILNQNDITFESQYKFDDLRSSKNSLLLFDFALFDKENLKCLIEFQGEQHYETDPSKSFGYAQRTYTDKRKRIYCNRNKIKLYEIKYNENVQDKINQILNEQNLLYDNPVPSSQETA